VSETVSVVIMKFPSRLEILLSFSSDTLMPREPKPPVYSLRRIDLGNRAASRERLLILMIQAIIIERTALSLLKQFLNAS